MMDLTKAFDCINRSLLWAVLYRKGIPIDLIRMLKEGHKRTTLAPKNKGTYGKDVEVNIGVFQGAAFSALGFIIYLCDMMEDYQALNDEEKLSNVYDNLPSEVTKEGIAKQRICRNAQISAMPADMPRDTSISESWADRTLIKYLITKLDAIIENARIVKVGKEKQSLFLDDPKSK